MGWARLASSSPLVAEIEPGQPDPGDRQQNRPEQRPEDRRVEQGCRNLADDGQARDMVRHFEEDRKEGEQRHHRIDHRDAEILHNRGEPHGVFLHALGRPLDGAHVMPDIRQLKSAQPNVQKNSADRYA